MYGKNATELQDGIHISTDNKISGTLHYVTDYTGYSNNDKEGNFLALHIGYSDGAEVKVTIVGGKTSNKKIDAGDHLLVTKVSNTSQKIRLDITYKGASDYVEYDLSGLVLESKETA